MVKPRARSSAPSEAEIEQFGNQAEAQPLSRSRTRNAHKEPKIAGINFRMTASQQRLLQKAADVEDISQQKILEQIVWPLLMDKYKND